jgi:hypothetical protein
VLGAAATALTAEWLRFQEGWTVAAVPAVLGATTTLAAVARSYRARRAWRRAREEAAAGEPLPPALAAESPPARVRARTARDEPHPSVLRHEVPASLLGAHDLFGAADDPPADDRASDRADAAPEGIAASKAARRQRERGRVETD